LHTESGAYIGGELKEMGSSSAGKETCGSNLHSGEMEGSDGGAGRATMEHHRNDHTCRIEHGII